MAGGTTTLCTCWRVELTDGAIYRFTDHDSKITIPDDGDYEPNSGFVASNIDTKTKLSVENLEASGFLSSDIIKEIDLMSGRWDFARVEIFRVNWNSIADGKDVLTSGRIGRIAQDKNTFKAEIRGLSNAYSQVLGKIYQPSCRASLGDNKCKVDMSAFTVFGELTDVSEDNLTLTDSNRIEPDQYFSGGLITMTSGDSIGLSAEVRSYSSGVISLQIQLPRGSKIGDGYTMKAGCYKRFNEDCVARFHNGINFRGEPHLPGYDRLMLTGDR
jgi:uncharacterized phage protein (TIGR02218 family)